jgi:hypothetical protein
MKCGAEEATYEIATFTSGVVVAAINMAATIATYPVPTDALSVLVKWATFTETFLLATSRTSTFARLVIRTRTPNWRDGPRVRIPVFVSGLTGVVTIAIAHLVHLAVLLCSYRESNRMNRQTRWIDVACNTHFDSELIRQERKEEEGVPFIDHFDNAFLCALNHSDIFSQITIDVDTLTLRFSYLNFELILNCWRGSDRKTHVFRLDNKCFEG